MTLRPPITIALASYNGAAFLPAQLQSFADQSEKNWHLLVSDDGSSDGTQTIVQDFIHSRRSGASAVDRATEPGTPTQISGPAADLASDLTKDLSPNALSPHAVGSTRDRIIDGPRQGSTRNFLHLVAEADPDAWLAFSDQDDLWLKDKLTRATAFLETHDGPAIYAARTTICDANLTPITPAPAYIRPLSFRNALIQSCLPGNTIVLNAPALRILKEAVPAGFAAELTSHDWWAYLVLAGAGAAIMRDTAQVLLYRQHGSNLMGRNDTTRARAARFAMLNDGSFAGWLDENQRALAPISHLLTAENRALLARFGAARRKSGPTTAAEFLRMGLYRQTRSGTVALMTAAARGRLASRDLD